MKTKEQKCHEAAERIKEKIEAIESLPEDQKNNSRWTLERLKLEYHDLMMKDESSKDKFIKNRQFSGYSIEDYLDDIEEYSESKW